MTGRAGFAAGAEPPDSKEMRLIAITVELHAFREELNWEEPLKLGIAITERPFIRMWQERGDRVGFDELPLQPEDFGDAGRVEVHDITDRLYPGIRNMEIGEVRIIEADKEPVGLALLRPDGQAFCVWIDEDRLNWGNEAALSAGTAKKKARIGDLFSCGHQKDKA